MAILSVLPAPVGYIWTGFDAGFSLSATGVLAYESAEYPVTELAWFDRRGRKLGRVGDPADYLNPWLGTDDRQVAVERVDPDTAAHQIWRLDRDADGNASRLTLARSTYARCCRATVSAWPISLPNQDTSISLAQGHPPSGKRGGAPERLPSTSSRPTGHSTAASFCTKRLMLGRDAISGSCPSLVIEHRILSCSRSSTKSRASCPPTGDGCHTSPTRPAGGRCTCGRSPRLGSCVRSPPRAAHIHGGAATGRRSSILGDRMLMAVELSGATIEPAPPRPLFRRFRIVASLPITDRTLCGGG